MSRPRFLTDEDVYGAVAEQLRRAEFDAVSTPEADRIGESDASQLAWAASQGRVLVTFNVAHLARLHYEWMSEGRHHCGLVVSAQRSIGDTVRRLLRLGRSLAAEDMTDRLEYLSNW